MKTPQLMAIGLGMLVIGVASTQAGEFDGRLRLGLTYVSGLGEVQDAVEDYYQSQGFVIDSTLQIPVGLQLAGSLDWYLGDHVSVGPDVRLGPSMIIIVSGADESTTFMLPVGAGARCTLFPKKSISPYVRGGVSYIIGTGDHFDSSDVGFEGAAGVEFLRNKHVGFGIEAGYNSCEASVAGQDVKPINFFAGIYASFKIGN